ncbi:MAG: hypothetical protein GXC73_20450, partial [Chitinophagaceae bacterium]|nr:hypothetical protein [Chitinophagaceae bacterium]
TLTLLVALILTFHTKAQNNDCNCEQTFDLVVDKLEANYIAYQLTKPQIEKEYTQQKVRYKKEASKTAPQDCSKLLQGFLSFFKDGHLFVSEYPDFAEEDLKQTKAYIKNNMLAVETAVLVSSNPLEGYWTDGTSKFVFTANKNKNIPFTYVAVIVETKDSSKIGEVKFGINLSGNSGEGSYYTNGYASRYVKVTGYKDNQLLSIWGGITWGRLQTKDAPLYNPVAAGFRKIDAKNAVLTIPSFLVDAKEFNQVLLDHFAELSSTEHLIIDIRGNTGGNGIYFDLLSTYYEKPAEQVRGFALSSDDNIAYFEKFISGNSNDPYAPVVKEMKEEKGKVVQGPSFNALELTPVKTAIKKVVILTDRGNMSAAETFVLFSKAISSKVIIMGENTAGVVDYNNINMVKLNCRKHGIYFGYPTYTLHNKVVTNGYNKLGIPPDVRIDHTVQDKIGFIVKYLQR